MKSLAVITSEAAHGTISAQRTNRRPGKRWLRSCASPSEITTVTATTAVTHTTVLSTTTGSAGCSSSRA
jgi:hypothetical protein